jgi:DNA primase
MIDKLGHVKAQISAMSGRFRPKEEHDGIKICCPFHGGGNERTPSCKVRTTGDIGRFYCFACRESGDWNKLCAATGMLGFKRSDQVHDVFSFVMPEVHYSETTPNLEDLKDLKPYNIKTPWRSIELETLQLFNAYFPKNPYYSQHDFFYLPVHVNKKYVGGIYVRRVVTPEGKKRGEISYINTKGKWSSHNVFGYDIARKRKGPLWYVEGPRDCLKITQLGGRAVAGLGSYVGPHKIRLLEALDPPAIIIGTDPDEAGDKARAYLKKHLPMIPFVEAEFPAGKDPACFTKKSYRRMMIELGFEKYVREAA